MKKNKKTKNGSLRKEEELKILRQIIRTISYNLDLKDVLNHIVRVVSNVTKADSCFLYLIDDGGLVLSASLKPKPKIIGRIKLKVGEGITGWVARERKIVAISKKAYLDSRFKLFNALPEDKYEAFLSVPIIYKDNVLGVINVQHRQSRKYSVNEVNLIEVIAKATGGAIENAMMYIENANLAQALEERKLVERAKGILMKELNISEEEAHGILRKKSMDKRIPLKEMAQAIIISSDLKKP